MKKIWINLLIFLVLCYGSLALQVQVSTPEVSVFTSNTEVFHINITNDLNTSIYFVRISSPNADLSFEQNDLNLSVNETRDVRVVLDTSTGYNSLTPINIIYYTKEAVVQTPENGFVNITATSYSPVILEIIRGSQVTWNNIDTIKHTVSSNIFDHDLESGGSFSYTFNDVGKIDYFDKFTPYRGSIVVKDTIGTDYVHNPLTDVSVSIRVFSLLVETSLQAEFVDNNSFTINVGDNIESVFILKNTGNSTATSIKFSSVPDWLSFSRNDAYIEVGKQIYVPFSIRPFILSSDQTDKYYNVTLFIRGNNSLPINQTLEVYVPFMSNVSENTAIQNLFNQSLDVDFLIAVLNIVCEARPEYDLCHPEIVERIVYQSPPIEFNITAEDVLEMRRATLALYEKVDRSQNNMQSLVGGIRGDTETTKNNTLQTQDYINELQLRQTQSEKEVRMIKNFFIILAIFIAIGVATYFIYYLIKKTFRGNRETST